MRNILSNGLMLALIFGAFFLSGHIGLLFEHYSESLAAGLALFGVSFIGLATTSLKLLVNPFS